MTPALARYQELHAEGFPGRSCGECRACCSTLAVHDSELDKPPYTPCQHECSSGCAVYERRPRLCASFACAWLVAEARHLAAEAFPMSERPDLLGVIVHQVERDGPAVREATAIARRLEYRQIANAAEVWPGALDSPAAGRLLRRLEDAGVFVLRRYADCETKVRLHHGARGVPYVTQERAEAKHGAR